jgi:hypothetical protein
METPFDWSVYAVGGAAARPDSFTGLRPDFARSLAAMLRAADAELGPRALRITSAYRSPEVQERLFADAVKRYGSEAAARRWVAPPGRSRHNSGVAVDLADANGRMLRDPNSREARWVAENAARFGLSTPLSWEPWHVEPAGSRSEGGGMRTPDVARARTSPDRLDAGVGMMSGGAGVGTMSGGAGSDTLAPPPDANSDGRRRTSLWDRVFPPAVLAKLGPLGDEERRLRIAATLFSLGVNPNPQLIAALNSQIENMQKERRENAQATRTIRWLESQGRPDLADAVRAGALSGRDAANIVYAQQQAGAESRDTARIREVEFLTQQFINQGKTPEEARRLALEVGFGMGSGERAPAQLVLYEAAKKEAMDRIRASEAGKELSEEQIAQRAADEAWTAVFGRSSQDRINEASGIAAVEAQAALLRPLATDLTSAYEGYQMVQELAGLSKDGVGGGIDEALNRIGNRLGVSLVGPKEKQFQAIVSRLALSMRPPGSGAISDADLEAFFASVPNLMNSPEGNRLIVETLEKLFRYRLQIARIANRGIRTGDMASALEEIERFSEENSPLRGFNERANAVMGKGAIQFEIIGVSPAPPTP